MTNITYRLMADIHSLRHAEPLSSFITHPTSRYNPDICLRDTCSNSDSNKHCMWKLTSHFIGYSSENDSIHVAIEFLMIQLSKMDDTQINTNRSGMTPVRRTYVVWGLYVNRGSSYVNLALFSGHILSHQVNSDIINVSCLMIGCQWESDDNKICVILTQPFGIPGNMQGFPSCRKSEQ